MKMINSIEIPAFLILLGYHERAEQKNQHKESRRIETVKKEQGKGSCWAWLD